MSAVVPVAASAAATPAAGPYSPLDPIRICDTRAGNPSKLSGTAQQCLGKTIAAGTSLQVSVADNFGVPKEATAVVVNLTAVNPAGTGFLTAYPTGQSPPTASNLNVTSGSVVANLVEVGIGAGGAISIYSSTRSDVVVDLEGYVNATAAGGTGSGLYNALPQPVRICDTRPNNPSKLAAPATQCNGHPLTAGVPFPIVVAGSTFGVPSGAIAVVANVTAVAPAKPGFLTAYPDGLSTPPTVSNVNYSAGQIVPNRVIVKLGTNGKLDILSAQAANVIVDISGYYTGTGGIGTTFTAEPSPVRICDTRAGNPSRLVEPATQCNGQSNQGMAVGPGGSVTVQVTGPLWAPSGAVAAVVNVTAIDPTQNTFLTVHPGAALPNTSDLNPPAGSIQPNLVVATLSSTGTFTVYNQSGTVNIAIDLTGWYQVPSTIPSTPTGLVAIPELTQLSLSWTAPASDGGSPIQGYNVFAGTSPNGESSTPVNGTTLVTSTNYTLTGLSQGITYFVTVQAVNAVGNSLSSNEASALPGPPLQWKTTAAAEPPIDQWSAISCPTAAFCVAVGGASGDATLYQSGTWSSPVHVDATSPSFTFLGLVSCVSSSLCVAVDNFSGDIFEYNAGTWSQDATPPATSSRFAALSCAAGGAFCMIIDSAGNTFTSSDGVNWSAGAAVPANTSVSALSCLSSASCLALMSTSTADGTYTWNGTGWSAGGSLPSIVVTHRDSVGSFSCSSAVACVASMSDPTTSSRVLYGYDGTTWTAAGLPNSDSPRGPVACAPGGACFATGFDATAGLAFFAYIAGAWTPVPNGNQGSFGAPNAMSCAAATFCGSALGGNSLDVFDGTSWTAAQKGGSSQVKAVSCATSAFCAAVDNAGDYVTFNGTSWTTAASVSGGITTPVFGPNAISCPVAGSCVAMDNNGNVWRYIAGAWSSPPADHSVVPASPGAAISCTASGFCAAASGAGVATYNTTTATWAATTIDSVNANLDSISCPQSNFCLAVDQSGSYATWNAGGWSALATFDSGASAAFSETVGCLSSSLCVATGGDGNAETYDGSTWSSSKQLAFGGSLGSPSCVPASISLPAYCVVSASNVVYYLEIESGAPTWSGAQSVPPNNTDQILALGCAPLLCVATGSQNYAWRGTFVPPVT
jgi:hypothetical protein